MRACRWPSAPTGSSSPSTRGWACTRPSRASSPPADRAGAGSPRRSCTLEEALDAYTRGSAFAEFAERDKGTLEPGKLADLAVFAEDLFALAPRRLLEVPVDLTVVGGRVVFERR